MISFRARLIATVILLIGLTAGAVAVVSYILVRDSLRDQLVVDSVARAEFNITVLATSDQLPADAGRDEFAASGLADRFLLRGIGGAFVEFPDGDTFASSLSLVNADAVVSDELRQIVEDGRFGYEFLTVGDEPTLVVGGRRPPDGPDFYFFYSATDVESALAALARVLIIAGVGVLGLGALGAGLIARRVLRPVATASGAAEAMAKGDLSVRIPTQTRDELGSLALSFNQMASSLEEQINALRRARERERRFVADVSHELRTPITALVNEAARLEAHLDDLPESERGVGQMLVADVGRLSDLVEDLLEISRLDAQHTQPERTEVDVPRFLAAVIAERHPSAELHIDGSVGIVRADRLSLERIVGNLLDNARHHAPDAPVSVTGRVEASVLFVEVTDHGPGVPEEVIGHIFDRFYKASEARGGGSGLGLAIAREHARRLGGDVTARRSHQGGMVFQVSIPVSESLHSGDAAENWLPHSEDEETNQKGSQS